MTDDELERFLRAFPNTICRHAVYADIGAWLKAENEAMMYPGTPCTLYDEPGVIVDEKPMFGEQHKVVITKNNIFTVPEDSKKLKIL